MFRRGVTLLFCALYVWMLPNVAVGQVTLDWGTLGFIEDQAIGTEVETWVDNVNYEANPYHGFENSSGGMSGWLLQSFDDVGGSGINLTVHQSLNSTDDVLEGPSLYGANAGPNPDCRVTAENALRINNDKDYPITPVTIVLSFSKPVTIQEFIVGSLSRIGTEGYENIIVRAFTGASATGATVPASSYENISDVDSDGTLVHGQGNLACAITDNQLANVVMGTPGVNHTYRALGQGPQDDDRYGRIKWSWTSPIQSIALSTWITYTASLTDNAYEFDYHSILIAPVTFTEASAFPVEWLEVTTTQSGADGLISWSAIETGNDYYVVERAVDSRAFEAVGSVAATLQQGIPVSYAFKDPGVANLQLDRVQYRLRQVDYDGSFSYSPIVELNLNRDLPLQIELSIYPNPVEETIFIQHESLTQKAIHFDIYTMQGNQVHHKIIPARGGTGVHPLDVSLWKPGIYVVHLYNEESSASRRFIIR